ncbi:type II secretion system protein GspM [Vreelandella sp. TE19]
MRPLTSRERKFAAISLLALLLWGAWYVVIEVPFLAPLREMAQQRSTLQTQQRHYAELIAQGEGLEAALAASRNDPALDNRLLAGDDANAVAADLMQLAIDRIAEHSDQGPGCEVTQRMPIVASDNTFEGPYRQVKVSLSLDCAIEPLAKILYAFEYGQPALFVDQLNVHRTSSAPATGGPGRLEVNLLLRGYLQKAGAQGGQA